MAWPLHISGFLPWNSEAGEGALILQLGSLPFEEAGDGPTEAWPDAEMLSKPAASFSKIELDRQAAGDKKLDGICMNASLAEKVVRQQAPPTS